MEKYIGHPHQLCGIEEFILNSGKGKGMKILHAFNGKGLELYILPDRCLDISKVSYQGTNISYISPTGYVAPAYYSKNGNDFLHSFTAGFLTTCGLENTGVPCIDNDEALPMHGSIHNNPAEHYFFLENEDDLIVAGTIRDEVIFGRKFTLNREIIISKTENSFKIIDKVKNTGDVTQPFEILYHINMGYPLLDEDSIVNINSKSVIGRNKHAQDDIENVLKITPPEPGYIERCYYHNINDKIGVASIYQPKNNIGLKIEYDTLTLDKFIQWKMLGYRDYVLGLECANCYPDGRNIMREKNILKFINPNDEIIMNINISFFNK